VNPKNSIYKRVVKGLFLIVVVIVLLVVLFHRFYLVPRYTVPILMYHSISDNSDILPNVKTENFSRQMQFLRDNRYNVISLDKLVKGKKNCVEFPRNTVVVTFDDGFRNNYVNAIPVLAKHDIPATVFVITDVINAGDKVYLSWDQVRLMFRSGVDFGSHTKKGKYLPPIESDTKELWSQIASSKEIIGNELGSNVLYFCYPSGGLTPKIINAVKKAGYEAACTTNRGTDRYNNDLYQLNRIKVTDNDAVKPFHFEAKLSGYYNLFRRLRKGH
jgi:peptidoglycan/xylan/chitin deacetylase (PgdA/CDA1 family)